MGKRTRKIERDKDGRLITKMPPCVELSTPILFSAMSYGSISYNAHAALAKAAKTLGICYNTGEGGLHEDFYAYGEHTIVQVASGRFGVHKAYLNAGTAVEIKMGQGAKPGIGGHLPGAKIVEDVSRKPERITVARVHDDPVAVAQHICNRAPARNAKW